MIYEIIYNGAFFGSFFGIAYFTFDGLLKLADKQNELAEKIKNLESLKNLKKK